MIGLLAFRGSVDIGADTADVSAAVPDSFRPAGLDVAGGQSIRMTVGKTHVRPLGMAEIRQSGTEGRHMEPLAVDRAVGGFGRQDHGGGAVHLLEEEHAGIHSGDFAECTGFRLVTEVSIGMVRHCVDIADLRIRVDVPRRAEERVEIADGGGDTLATSCEELTHWKRF